MDPYSSERWILESHETLVSKAELRARLVPDVDREPGALSSWIAWRLRELADRIDGEGRQERLHSSA
jgi:hypothetical protein